MNPVRSRNIRTALWTAVSVVGTIIGLLVLSTINNPDGTPWLESSLLGQTIVVVGSLSAIVLPTLIGARRDAAVARDQLENSHVQNADKVSNVRDDLDHKHSALLEALESGLTELSARMDRKFDGVYAEFRGTRGDIGRAAKQADAARDAADKLRDKVDTIAEQSDSVASKVDGIAERIDSVEAKVDGIVEVATGTIPVVEKEEDHE